MINDLYTQQGEEITENPWQVYPRPQLERDSYLNLNGRWDFAVSTGKRFPEYDKTILVPFCPQSLLSGIKEHYGEETFLYYRRALNLPKGFHKGKVLLHFGAVDQVAEVYLNRQIVGKHVGGYEAFSLDITDYLQDTNVLEVRVKDDLRSKVLPYGKQTLKRGGMWYTPVSGIWQSVWLESVPEQYIQNIRVENRGYSVKIAIQPAMDAVVTVAGLGDFQMEKGTMTITPENPRLWSPEKPYLYDFTVTAGEDRVESYFAIRSLEIKKVGKYQRLCLNGKPYFFHGLLDQGYWPDGLLTPADPACYEDDILAMKALGFNMLRKHIKVEADEFYYQCDRLGMVVFQDMVNNGAYGYVRDTVLPTIFPRYQKRPDRNLHPDPETRRKFLAGMEATVTQLGSFPCICLWTIFNEGWGQFDADMVYEKFHALDDTRFIDATSGWFRRKKTQVDSRHVYFRKIRLKGGDKPLYLSEFGGYSYKVEGHSFNPDETYGYGKFTDGEAFAKAFTQLYMEQVAPAVEAGLCATVYTQVSDVEDETNGLRTYDRAVEKLTPEQTRPIADALRRAMEKSGCKISHSGVK